MKFRYILFLLFVYFFSTAQTEKNIDHQSLLWTRYYNLLTINNNWSLHSEFDNRIFINPIKENLYAIRIHSRYKINKDLDVGAGMAYFSVATQVPELTFDFDVPEYRAQQDISWKQDMGKIILLQRFQVEERFFQNSNNERLLRGTTFFWRFRYKFQGEFSLWGKEQHYLKAILYDELMINSGKNVGENIFDQNRIYTALNYGINKNTAFELGYLNSFQQRSSGTDYFNRDIIRFTFFHKINLKEKKY